MLLLDYKIKLLIVDRMLNQVDITAKAITASVTEKVMRNKNKR